MITFDDGSGPAVYTQGYFLSQHWSIRSRIIRWRGSHYEILDSGLPGLIGVEALRVLDDGSGPRLCAAVAVAVPVPGGITLEGRWFYWTGTSWIDTPPGLATEYDNPECTFDDGMGPAIYGAGLGGFKKWNGVSWEIIGVPHGINNWKMQAFDLGDGPSLYIFGQFNGIEGVPNTRGIARWDGTRWHALGMGVHGTYLEACVFDDGKGKELYIAGSLFAVEGRPATVAKWNGHRWAVVHFPSSGALDQMVVFDDGQGPALVAKGVVPDLNGLPARGFVKFDGQQWHILPGAANSKPTGEMTVFNEDPRGPSIFMLAGGGAPDVNQFVGCAGGRSCYADCDNTGDSPRLTANDFMCFLNRFVMSGGMPGTRDPYADCNQDRLFNAADFQCFLAKFAFGCP
jgi:hypothetical protein